MRPFSWRPGPRRTGPRLQERIETVTDGSDLEDVYQTERHLLYVACIRARPHADALGELQPPARTAPGSPFIPLGFSERIEATPFAPGSPYFQGVTIS